MVKSNDLAKKKGSYINFDGSPYSLGIFQWELWNKDESYLLMGYDWNALRKKIVKSGIRNSLLTTVMPTASTSQMLYSSSYIRLLILEHQLQLDDFYHVIF